MSSCPDGEPVGSKVAEGAWKWVRQGFSSLILVLSLLW